MLVPALAAGLLCLAGLPNPARANGPAQKPLPPLEISIATAQQGITPQPGDAVELAVTARSALDASEATITIKLSGDVELLSGELAWSGPVKKGESTILLITVRVPAGSRGMVKARISLPATADASFSREARYSFGKDKEQSEKQSEEKPVKKDRRGRDIIEYR